MTKQVRNKKDKRKQERDNWHSLFRTIGKLKLPWIWIIVGLSINLLLNNMLLDLPDTTADLMSGELTGAALTKAIIYYVVIGVLSFIAVAGQVQAQSYSVKRARDRIWNKMLSMRMEYFDRNDPTDMMSAITNDAGSALNDFANILVYLLPDLYYVVMALRRIGQYHWILVVSCFAMFPLKYLYAWLMGRQVQKTTAVLYGKIGELTEFLADRISHLPLVKAYTNEEKEDENGRKAAHKLYKANMRLVYLDNISEGVVSAIDVMQKFVVIVVAVILLQQGRIDMAMWIAFFLFAQNLFTNIDELFELWIKIKGMHGEFHRIIDIMDGPDEDMGAAVSFPEEGDIEFRNISFSYSGADHPALDNISFKVPRGTSLAIVGLCGSGKTTSVSLLERFYEQDSGDIYIGDTSIKDISLSEFRRNLAYVQQGAEVFSGTLREAITYGIDRQVSDDEIREAAAKTGFDEYMCLCKEGLDTEVSSGGDSMSGGQRQRLVLTREFLRNGSIILMDEPTSALDVQVSAKIQDTMDRIFADKTRILITHDLSFARKYDRIVVLENGRIVGEGSHEALLENCRMYRKMNENAGEEAVV